MSSTRRNQSTIGRCPECHTGLTASTVLIRYETGSGGSAVWADCPQCREVVHPE